MTELFRRQALEARNPSMLGTVCLPRVRFAAIASALSASIVLAGVSFAAIGTYTKRARVEGVLVPSTGLVVVRSPVAGTVANVTGIESEIVAEKRILATISGASQAMSGANIEAALVALNATAERELVAEKGREDARLTEAQETYREQRLLIEEQIRNARATLDIHERRQQISRAALERFEALHARGFVSQIELLEQQSAVLQTEAAKNDARAKLATLRREVEHLSAQALQSTREYGRAIAELDRRIGDVDRARLAQERNSGAAVISPQRALIAARLIEPGQSVEMGQPLFILLPENAELEAHLFVAGDAIPSIRKDSSVLLRYDAFPFEKYGHRSGTVSRVSTSAIQPSSEPTLPQLAQSQEPRYRVVVSLDEQRIQWDGGSAPLLPGMKVQAEVLLETRSILEWMYRPLARATAE